MIERHQRSDLIKKIIDQAFEGRSIPISRRIILSHYLGSMLKGLKEG
jgi:hypothetical protein